MSFSLILALWTVIGNSEPSKAAIGVKVIRADNAWGTSFDSRSELSSAAPLIYYASRKQSGTPSQPPPPATSPSAPASPASATPDSPTTASLHTVTLTWDPVSHPDLAGYRLYVGTQPGRYETTLDIGAVASYRYQGLQPGTSYYFAVSAYDRTGTESPKSNEVSYTASAPTPVHCGVLGRKFVCTN